MKLQVVQHEFSAAGKALRVDDGDVDAFLGWAHIPSLGSHAPAQFAAATYACDLEVWDDGILVVHKERAFPTEQKAKAWFRFVAWCLTRLKPADFESCHNLAWGLS